MAAASLPLSSLLLLLLLPLLLTPPALAEVRRLADCPNGTLTLEVPEDMPAGYTLFSWDPARLSVATRLNGHPADSGRTVLSRASAHARAFFGIDFAFAVMPGQSRVALTMALPAGGSDRLRSHVSLNCTAKQGGPTRLFTLELRLVRIPLRLLVELQRPRPSRWAPAGTVVATVGAFSFGRRVQPESCSAEPGPRGRPLTVGADGKISLAAPPFADEADDAAAAAAEDEESLLAAKWTASVTCEWRGRRASELLTVSPLRLWRRRFIRVFAAASDSGAALTGASLRIQLSPLLLSQKGLRLRLTGCSHPALARLEPAVSLTDPVGSLLLVLPPDGQPLTLTLEASDPLGSSEFTSLILRSGRLTSAKRQSTAGDASPHSHSAAAGSASAKPAWPMLAVLLSAAAVALLSAGAAVLVCVCLSRRQRRLGGVKPQFV